jgi:hypothetical protein
MPAHLKVPCSLVVDDDGERITGLGGRYAHKWPMPSKSIYLQLRPCAQSTFSCPTSIMIRSYDHANPLRSDAFSLVIYIHRNHPVISSRP